MERQLSRSANSPWSAVLLLLAVVSVAFFLRLGDVRLWDRDEPRNAGAALEMMQRGDWIVPTFNDQLRHQKPIMQYWLMLAAYHVLGPNEFAARFWSALLGSATVLMTYAAGSRMFGRRTGFWAAICLATSVMFGVASRAATPDAILIFFMAAALVWYVHRAWDRKGQFQDENPFRSLPWAVTFYGILGCAVLTKGLVGFLIPMATLGLFLLLVQLPEEPVAIRNELGWLQRNGMRLLRLLQPMPFMKVFWSMRPALGFAVVMLVAAPWFVAVGVRTDGEFLRRFFVDEHLGRFNSSFESHSGGWWYYPVAIMVGFFPWSLFAWPVIADTDRWLGRKRCMATTLMLCWIGIQVGLFTLAKTKLPSYVTPCYPALAVLSGAAIARLIEGKNLTRRVWYQWAFGTLAATTLVAGLGMGFAAGRYLSGHWELAFIFAPLWLSASYAAVAVRTETARAFGITAVAAVGTVGMLWGWGAVTVDSTRQIQTLLADVGALPASTHVATYRCLESSWVFYGQHPIHELADQPSSPPSLKRSEPWSPFPRLTPEQFAALEPESVYLTTVEHAPELLERLPGDFEIRSMARYFLKDETVVLIARKETRLRSAEKAPARPADRF